MATIYFYGLFMILLSGYHCADPVPPTTWPLTWSTWVVVTIIDSSKQNPIIYNTGQMLAYDPGNQYACRYNQQDLITPSSNRSVDMCDYSKGYHYTMNSYSSGVNCTSVQKFNGTLSAIIWPPSFLSAAKFQGTDIVAGSICNHFVAVGVSIDGKTQQMDVWTTQDTGYPCQISSWDMGTTIHYNWAFDGFTEFISPQAVECSAPQIICTEKDWLCSVKPGMTNDSLGEQLQWVCQPSRLDCSPINPYGDHFLPNTVQDHCNWAFNEYYQLNRVSLGLDACDFNGTAQLIPPSWKNPFNSRRSVLQSGSLISNANLIC